LGVALSFINNIKSEHVKLAKNIGADRLRKFVLNPLGYTGRENFKKLDDNEALAMFADAVRRGFELKVNGSVNTTNINTTFFFRDEAYYIDIGGKYFQWDSSSKKFIPSDSPFKYTPKPV
jgi:hypothetical protein